MSASPEYVILVNQDDKAIGKLEKMEAHKRGVLHRAFSVFLFNSNNELLIQQRADEKYHTPGLWSNTCCSHPAPNETLEEAVHRKLKQEMGITTRVEKKFVFTYKSPVNDNLIENEVDHIYAGKYNDVPVPNPDEVKSWRYVSLQELRKEISENEKNFTPWFKLLMNRVNDIVDKQ